MFLNFRKLPIVNLPMKNRLLIFNIALPAISGVLIFIYIFYGRTGKIPAIDIQFWPYFISLLFGMIVGILMWLLDKRLKKSWDNNGNITGMLALQLIIKLLMSLTIVFIAMCLYLLLFDNIEFSRAWTVYYDEVIKIIILTMGMVLIFGLVSFTLQSYNYYAFHRIERLRQERDQLELQFEALKSQLSPHYLFNCLNTISSLIHRSAMQTEDFIRRMAKTFQYVLNNDKKKLVTIGEEIAFVKSYNYLLKVRFENQLRLDIELEKDILDCLIPPLTLQLLMENAVKHNLIDENHSLVVRIYSEGPDFLIIENSKSGIPQVKESFNIGLENIRKRYHYLCDKKITVHDNEKFIVKLPILQSHSEVYE